MLVSIVIPCYNSEHTIEEVVDLCMEEFAQMDGYECEMILVNDFSKDGTFEAIKRAAGKYPNVTGINLAKNFGQHAAIMAGLHYVKGELVVGMDDDMQNHPFIATPQSRQVITREGWQIDYISWIDGPVMPLPKRIDLIKGGNNAIDVDIHLKLVIDEWQFPKSK